MADTRLKSITMRNWTTVRQATIEFPAQGLILLRGINRASNGKMASIGSGKSALGEAISRCLFEVKGRYTQLGHYSTHEKGDTLVEVNCEHKGKPLKVEMGFKCEEINPRGEGLRFTYSTPVMRSRIEETRQDLVKILTVPSDLASWAVHLDGDTLKFGDLSERKAVDLLMSALVQPRYTNFAKRASDQAYDLKKDLARERQDIESAKSNVAEIEVKLHTANQNLIGAKNVYAEALKAIDQAKAQLDAEIVQFSSGIAEKQAQMQRIKKDIETRTAANAQAEHQQEIAVNEKREKLDAAKDQQRELKSAETLANQDLDAAQLALAQAEKTPKNCPTCGKAWNKAQQEIANKKQMLEEAQTLQVAAQEDVATQAATLSSAQAALAQAEAKLRELKAQNPIEDLSQQYEDLETALTEDQTNLSAAQEEKAGLAAGPDASDVTRFDTQVQERQSQLQAAQAWVQEAVVRLADGEEMLRVVEYWQEAFGPSGIPNMVLHDALGPLNATAKRISAMMTGGTIDISYATSRDLAKGGEKSELVIKVKNDIGGARVEGSSKGEGGLVNLIVAETLAEVGGVAKRIGYRFYDEVGANQDEVVRRSIYAYLAEIARRYGILIFLVTHAAEAANYADYTLVAEKTSEGTTYRWG